MKRVKIQILIMVILLGKGISLYCMTAALRRMSTVGSRPVTSGMSRATAARLAAMESQKSFQQNAAVESKPDTSTGWGWFKSLFQRSQRQPASAQISSKPSPFSPGGQRRSFSTTIPQRTSFWDKVASFFEKKPLQEESLLSGDAINRLVWGHTQKEGKDAWGDIFRTVFDKNDLQIAKEKIGRMIQLNPEYKSIPIIKNYEYSFKFRERGPGFGPDFTVLDIVFLRLFEGDTNHFSLVQMSPSDNALNQIELIKYLIDMGAQINPANYDLYKRAYRDLMNNWSYKRLYEENAQNLYGAENEIQKFKEIFKELDPILEKIIPGFKNELDAIQKERAEIEANPEVYRKKVEEEDNRRSYKYAKARQMSNDYNRRTGDAYASYPNEFVDKVEFNETEYQTWLQSGKDSYFFSGNHFRDYFKAQWNDFNQEIENSSEEERIWDLLPGLTATSSKEEIAKAFRDFSKTHHSDAVKQLVQSGAIKKEEGDERIQKYKEVTAAWDAYNEQLKKEKKKKTRQ